MDTPRVPNHAQIPPERLHQEPDTVLQDDEVLAWEQLGDDLWLPYRIRGSWRGGVLG